MPHLPRPLLTLSTVALASAGIALGAAPASAALTTYCEGDAADVTVPGDLVVAKGDSCVLDGVTVDGTTRVAAGADLVVEDSTFHGKVTVASDGYLDATASTFDGNLINKAGYGVYLEDSALEGSYRGKGVATADTFLYSYDTTISGKVQAAHGEVSLETVQVGGDLTTDDTVYTDVVDSTLAGGLHVSGSAEGSALCASEVDGDAHYSGNQKVQIGTGLDLVGCTGSNYLGGDLLIENSTDAVDVTGNIIRGDLQGTGNAVTPTGSENRVRGEVGGQFTDLKPAARTLSAQSSASDHSRTLDDRRAERRSDAEAAAELAGPAPLR